MSQFRKLKIQGKFRTRTRDIITVSEIRLEGKWLEELGFEEGKEVRIKQQRDKLIITLHKEE